MFTFKNILRNEKQIRSLFNEFVEIEFPYSLKLLECYFIHKSIIFFYKYEYVFNIQVDTKMFENNFKEAKPI